MNLNQRIELPFFERFGSVLRKNVWAQVIAMGFGAIMLDGGAIMRMAALASLIYWMCVFIIMLRRDVFATPFDRKILTWGFALAIPIAEILTVAKR